MAYAPMLCLLTFLRRYLCWAISSIGGLDETHGRAQGTLRAGNAQQRATDASAEENSCMEHVGAADDRSEVEGFPDESSADEGAQKPAGQSTGKYTGSAR